MRTITHPGVYVPPPLLYAAFFFFSFLPQKLWPLKDDLLHTSGARVIAAILLAVWLLVAIAAVRRFVLTNNTLMTIRPATSLQTTGIYAFSRNPMYLSLLLLYSGLAVFFGNWWTLILLPLLMITLRLYVINREERYLHAAFGDAYAAYQRRVRRWI
jgi:protein-S-isoprenylcysteine O-methyltransferase Ste14